MKKSNRILLTGLSLSTLLLLAGCVGRDSSGNPSGLIWNLLGQPMSYGIRFFAENQGLGFGLGIIIVTIIVRLIILPLALHQSWTAAYQTEKREYLKPYLQPYQDRLTKAETQEEKLAAQQALMAAQKEMGVSILGGMGCLPLLIQLPFFSAIFFAAQYTPGVSDASFLGIHLGERSILLALIVGVLYLIQGYLSMLGVAEEQRQQMRSMMFMSPIMLLIFSWSSPASVTLYWFVGGIFTIIQQLITNFILRPRLREKVTAEFEANPPKMPSQTATASRKDVTPQYQGAISTDKKKQNRNAGKQRSR
ncbi:Inner membrane protein translocase component YidC, OxaA protein [Streptococcus sp. DD10]|uniref:membrane protein insertase YidC n=1 Tax=Streptococcus sp. DD10 TaxID=1777878 RepID=UPI00079201A2|nr:membrane protein insertase YidC [Streptococcus sp. DD10]KXT74201.1 Inner membrane protein translocase component YidC, OxaA protein [Streptococcus sp. DD10]